MKKNFLVLSLIMILIVTFAASTVFAANYSFTASMTANNSKVTAGSEVLITVKLSNLDVGETGINSFSAYLSYDTDMFETLTDSSIDGCNGWVANYTPGTGKVSLVRPTLLKTDEEIMQISLKTKSGLTDGTQGEIKLSTIIVSNSTDEIGTSPVSTSITIGNSTAPDPVVITPSNTVPNNGISPIPVNTVPTPSNNTANTSNNTSIIIGPSINTTNTPAPVVNEAGNDMPYTGTDSGSLARIIIGVIFIALVIYLKIQRMDRDIR